MNCRHPGTKICTLSLSHFVFLPRSAECFPSPINQGSKFSLCWLATSSRHWSPMACEWDAWECLPPPRLPPFIYSLLPFQPSSWTPPPPSNRFVIGPIGRVVDDGCEMNNGTKRLLPRAVWLGWLWQGLGSPPTVQLKVRSVSFLAILFYLQYPTHHHLERSLTAVSLRKIRPIDWNYFPNNILNAVDLLRWLIYLWLKN
jgi:hypothetical protein